MILRKVLINYYSYNVELTKNKLINILKEFGIFEYELVENFSHNSLDYENEFNNENDIWSIIFTLPDNRFFDKKINMIKEAINSQKEDEIIDIYTSKLDTDSYKDEWKKSFFTTKITDKITINPSWIDYTKKDNEIVISIDPSIAFGTGTHETTSLCIQLLEKYYIGHNSLLDIGCGSGILMLVSKKLGINLVTGVDIDKNCYEIVNNNYIANNLDNCDIRIGNLVDNINDKYDIIVSNILVDVLENLLEDISKVSYKNSIYIFSGIIEEKKKSLLN